MTARALAQEKSMGVRGNEPHASTPEAAGSPITSRTATPVYNGSSSAGMASDVNASSIRRTRSPAAFYLLTVGSCLFGSYIMYCLCCGGISSQYTRVLRRPILSLGGRVINGVDLTELAASAWCICCILAADYLHWKLIAPTTCCVGLSCPSLEWIVIHAVPSAYLNVTFFYNWCMCIFFTRPQDAYTEEQCDRFLKKQQLQSWVNDSPLFAFLFCILNPYLFFKNFVTNLCPLDRRHLLNVFPHLAGAATIRHGTLVFRQQPILSYEKRECGGPIQGRSPRNRW